MILHRIARLAPPEHAHALALAALRLGLIPKAAPPPLPTRVMGIEFPNPVGLAAGFDKNATATRAAMNTGFGFVEVGTVTPRPQPGNPKPRLFRLPQHRALINRLGFNSHGHDRVRARLSRPRPRPRPLGVNLGANRDSPDPVADYLAGLKKFAPLADYAAVNISSPNTPGLRDLQHPDALSRLCNAIRADAPPIPVLLKIAPDLTPAQAETIARIAADNGIAGIIVANTTVRRTGIPADAPAGGLSGPPLALPATALIAHLFSVTGGQIPLIGVGGITTATDAYHRLRAGASLVQIYTALAWNGFSIVDKIIRELAVLLARDGYDSPAQAVGVDVKKEKP